MVASYQAGGVAPRVNQASGGGFVIVRTPDGTTIAVPVQDVGKAVEAGNTVVSSTVYPDSRAANDAIYQSQAEQTVVPSQATDYTSPSTRDASTNPISGSPQVSGGPQTGPGGLSENRPLPTREERESRSRGSVGSGSSAANIAKLAAEAGMPNRIDINPDLFPELMNPDGSMRDISGPDMGGDNNMGQAGGVGRDPAVYDDLGAYNPFTGTWAEGGPAGDQSVMNMIQQGQMTPELATEFALRDRGYEQYAFQDAMEQQYATYPGYYNMMNPGGAFLTPDEQYIHGGQFVQDMASNVGTGNTMIPDYRGAWDMQFDPAAIGFNDDMMSGDAGESQKNLILQNIQQTLAPAIGSDNTAYLSGMVENAYQDYVYGIASGTVSPDTGFTTYLQSIGAGEWF